MTLPWPRQEPAYLAEIRARRKNIFGSCYDFKESLGWWIRNRFGVRDNVAHDLDPIPRSFTVDDQLEPRLEIGFVGDIMDLHGYELIVADDILESTRAVDYLLGNFEATITDQVKIYQAQRFNPEVLPLLGSLKEPSRFFLSTANNHAGDFGREEFTKSCKLATDAGFRLFGLVDAPHVDITPQVRVVTGTRWSNLMCDYVPVFDSFSDAALERLGSLAKPGAVNILYFHWGYELELYPRPGIIDVARKLLGSFDMIIGHHPHVPQPCTRELVDGRCRLVAYSLGNFITGRTKEMKQYGLFLKVKVGPDSEGNWGLRGVETEITNCTQVDEKHVLLTRAKAYPYSNLAL